MTLKSMKSISKLLSKLEDKQKKLEKKKQDGVTENTSLEEEIRKTEHEVITGIQKVVKQCEETIAYEDELEELQKLLIQFQTWVQVNKKKVIIIFEGRDTAWKWWTIKRITQHLNPRVCRVVALGKPTEVERGQWYFQRYFSHLPNEGEIVLFDRSWYNRAGVERVFGFCSKRDYEHFLKEVSEVEKRLVDNNFILLKYYLSITKETQKKRLSARMTSDLKKWKLSDIDVKGPELFGEYTKAKERMFEASSTPECPWVIVDANNKKKARLDVIKHILLNSGYQESDTSLKKKLKLNVISTYEHK